MHNNTLSKWNILQTLSLFAVLGLGACSMPNGMYSKVAYPSEFSEDTIRCIETIDDKKSQCLQAIQRSLDTKSSLNLAQGLYEMSGLVSDAKAQNEIRLIAIAIDKNIWQLRHPDARHLSEAQGVVLPKSEGNAIHFKNFVSNKNDLNDSKTKFPNDITQQNNPVVVTLSRSTIEAGEPIQLNIPRILQSYKNIHYVLVNDEETTLVYAPYPILESFLDTKVFSFSSLNEAQKWEEVESLLKNAEYFLGIQKLSEFIADFSQGLQDNNKNANKQHFLEILKQFKASLEYAMLLPVEYRVDSSRLSVFLESLPESSTRGVKSLESIQGLKSAGAIESFEWFTLCAPLHKQCTQTLSNTFEEASTAYTLALCLSPLTTCDHHLHTSFAQELASHSFPNSPELQNKLVAQTELHTDHSYLELLKWRFFKKIPLNIASFVLQDNVANTLFPINNEQKLIFCDSISKISGINCTVDELFIQPNSKTLSSLSALTQDAVLQTLLDATQTIVSNENVNIEDFYLTESDDILKSTNFPLVTRLSLLKTLLPSLSQYFLRTENFHAVRTLLAFSRTLSGSLPAFEVECTTCVPHPHPQLSKTDLCLRLRMPQGAFVSESKEPIFAESFVSYATDGENLECHAVESQNSKNLGLGTLKPESLLLSLEMAILAASQDQREWATGLSLDFVQKLQEFYKFYGHPTALNRFWGGLRFSELSCKVQALIQVLLYHQHPFQALLVDRAFGEVFPSSTFLVRNAHFNACIEGIQKDLPGEYPREEILRLSRWIETHFIPKNKKISKQQKALIKSLSSKDKNVARVMTSFAAYSDGEAKRANDFVSGLTRKKSVYSYPRLHLWEQFLEIAVDHTPSHESLVVLLKSLFQQELDEGYLFANFAHPYLDKSERDAIVSALFEISPQPTSFASVSYFVTYFKEFERFLDGLSKVSSYLWAAHTLSQNLGNQTQLLLHLKSFPLLWEHGDSEQLLREVNCVLNDSFKYSLNKQQIFTLLSIQYALQSLIYKNLSQDWLVFRFQQIHENLSDIAIKEAFSKLNPEYLPNDQDIRSYLESIFIKSE